MSRRQAEAIEYLLEENRSCGSSSATEGSVSRSASRLELSGAPIRRPPRSCSGTYLGRIGYQPGRGAPASVARLRRGICPCSGTESLRGAVAEPSASRLELSGAPIRRPPRRCSGTYLGRIGLLSRASRRPRHAQAGRALSPASLPSMTHGNVRRAGCWLASQPQQRRAFQVNSRDLEFSGARLGTRTRQRENQVRVARVARVNPSS